MLKRLVSLFSAGPCEENQQHEQERIQLAACVLLLEVAHSDGEFHAAEQDVIDDLLQRHFNVTAEASGDLQQLAEEVRHQSGDLHQFTKLINANFDQQEKEEIIEAVWQLVYADGRLDHYEEALMRQLGHLIGLSHRQLIAGKMKVLELKRAEKSQGA